MPWLFLSLLAHAGAVAAGVAWGVRAEAAAPQGAPRVQISTTVALAPVAPPAVPPPCVEIEDVRPAGRLAEVQVVESFDAAAPPAVEARPPRDTVAPTLEIVRRVEPQPLEPVDAADAAPNAALPQARVDASPCADNEPPAYPEDDRVLGHEGTVIVAVSVDARGGVLAASLRSGAPFPGLNREALRAVRRWRFEPARCDGQPVAGVTEVRIEFRLQAGGRR